MLQTESDFLFVIVNVQDHDFDFFIDLHHLRRVIDAAPAHIGDMQQAINTAQVDEGTEVGDILDQTCAEVTYFQVAEKFLLHLLACFFDQPTTRNNDVSTSLIDFQNHAFDVLPDVVGNIRRTTHIDLTGGQKDVHTVLDDGLAFHFATNRDQQTTFDFANDRSLDDVALRVGLDDLFPVADTIGFPLRQDDQTDGILEFLQQHFNRRTDFGQSVAFLPFIPLDDTFALVSDIDDHFFVVNSYDRASQNVVDIVCLSLCVNYVFKGIKRSLHDGFQLSIINIELAKKVTIYHC